MLSNKNNKRKSSRNNKKTKKRNNVKSKNRKYRINTKSKTLIGGAGEPVIQQTDPPRYIYTYVATLDSKMGKHYNFNKPSGVTISHDNRIYVCDKNNRVQIFHDDAPKYTYIDSLGKGKKGILSFMNDTIHPSGVAVSPNPNNPRIYVSDPKDNTVWMYNVNDLSIITGLGGKLFSPMGVAISYNGEKLYVADTDNNCIKVISTKNQMVVETFGNYHLGSFISHDMNLGFNTPMSVAVSRDNRIYVADTRNHRIQIFNGDTSPMSYIATLGPRPPYLVRGTSNTEFNFPNGVAVSTDNFIYIADTNNHRVQVFDGATLTYIATIGTTGSPGSSNTQFNFPVSVAVSPDGKRIYVADRDNNRIQMFDKEYILVKGYKHNGTNPSITSTYTNLPSPKYVQTLRGNAVGLEGLTGIPNSVPYNVFNTSNYTN